MAPAELLNDDVSVKKNLADVDWVVAADLVVRHAFVLAGVVVLEEIVADEVLHGHELFLVVGCLRLVKLDVGYGVTD